MKTFCSFGHMNLLEKREQTSKADLVRATLVTVLNNIASISMMCARTEVIKIGFFVLLNCFNLLEC